jgi:uncharacterized protein GlcG (DUF336 family)
MKRILICGAALGALAILPAQAQAPAAMPAAPVIRSGAPQPPNPPVIAIPAEKQIPLDQALAAVQAAMQSCLAKNSKNTVSVTDLNGNIKVLLSSDGAANSSFEYARTKAYTVLKKGVSSKAFGQTLGTVPRGTVIQGDPNLTQYAGGQPIMKNGAMIGALAVSSDSGQDNDEACSLAGMAQFHL